MPASPYPQLHEQLALTHIPNRSDCCAKSLAPTCRRRSSDRYPDEFGLRLSAFHRLARRSYSAGKVRQALSSVASARLMPRADELTLISAASRKRSMQLSRALSAR